MKDLNRVSRVHIRSYSRIDHSMQHVIILRDQVSRRVPMHFALQYDKFASLHKYEVVSVQSHQCQVAIKEQYISYSECIRA